MNDLRTAAQQALEALQSNKANWPEKTNAITALRAALTQQAEPVELVAHRVVAGALFDFMGWLTSRRERLVLSSTDDAAPAADAIKDFAEMRGLSLDDAKVQDWNAALAQQAEPVEPVAAERERCAEYLMQQAAECRENSPTRVTLESCAAVLRLGLHAQAEPVEPPKPSPLKRGITGRCTRKVCECEKEGLGPECIYLEPVVDGYPLWSGIPKAEPVEPVAWIYQNMYTEQEYLVWKKGTGGRNWRPLYTAPPQRKPLPKHDQHCVDVPGYGLMAVRLVRAVERAHGIGEEK